MGEVIAMLSLHVFEVCTLITLVSIMWRLKSIVSRLALIERPMQPPPCEHASFVEHQTEVNAAIGKELARLDERIEGVPRGGPFR